MANKNGTPEMAAPLMAAQGTEAIDAMTSGDLCDADVRDPAAVTPIDASDPARRDPRGRFQPGNRASLKHGLYAKDPQTAMVGDLDLAALDTFEAEIVSDLGGSTELSAIERGYVGKLRSVEALCQLAVVNIQKNGLTTRTETQLLQAIDRWDRLASRLGMKRRTREVTDLAKALSGLERK